MDALGSDEVTQGPRLPEANQLVIDQHFSDALAITNGLRAALRNADRVMEEVQGDDLISGKQLLEALAYDNNRNRDELAQEASIIISGQTTVMRYEASQAMEAIIKKRNHLEKSIQDASREDDATAEPHAASGTPDNNQSSGSGGAMTAGLDAFDHQYLGAHQDPSTVSHSQLMARLNLRTEEDKLSEARATYSQLIQLFRGLHISLGRIEAEGTQLVQLTSAIRVKMDELERLGHARINTQETH
jgi:hypothetical protein